MRQAWNDLDDTGHTESNAVLGFAIPTQSIEEHFGAGYTALEKARTDKAEFDTAWAADIANNAGAICRVWHLAASQAASKSSGASAVSDQEASLKACVES